jgi:CRISPR-associated protein Cas5h
MSINHSNINKVLVFDLKGTMAHFRKYYTNSTSLSYLFPPKTVINGLIAGLLGLPNEKYIKNDEKPYYEKFDDDKCYVSVSLRTKIRKIMQTVNYSFTKTDSKIIDFSKHTQIPIEILLPEKDYELSYRIYFYHKCDKIYNKLRERLKNKQFIYPPYLGITEFIASIDYINEGEIFQKNSNEHAVEIRSVCKVTDVELILSSNNKEQRYLTERMPTGFSNERMPKNTENYLLETNCNTLNVKLKNNNVYFTVSYSEGGCKLNENIIFM